MIQWQILTKSLLHLYREGLRFWKINTTTNISSTISLYICKKNWEISLYDQNAKGYLLKSLLRYVVSNNGWRWHSFEISENFNRPSPPSRPSAINILEMLDSENNNFVTVSLISHETYVNQLTLTLEYTDISLELECGYLIYQRL